MNDNHMRTPSIRGFGRSLHCFLRAVSAIYANSRGYFWCELPFCGSMYLSPGIFLTSTKHPQHATLTMPGFRLVTKRKTAECRPAPLAGFSAVYTRGIQAPLPNAFRVELAVLTSCVTLSTSKPSLTTSCLLPTPSKYPISETRIAHIVHYRCTMDDFNTVYHTTEALRNQSSEYTDYKVPKLENYHRFTMPVCVAHRSQIEVFICSTTEPFIQFMRNVQKTLGLESALEFCTVKWGFAESHLPGETSIQEDNFQVVLRMMQACPGKAVFYVR